LILEIKPVYFLNTMGVFLVNTAVQAKDEGCEREIAID
jgi:hypothetical protein